MADAALFVRDITDRSTPSSTRRIAVTKGYAIGSAGPIAALGLFADTPQPRPSANSVLFDTVRPEGDLGLFICA